ncbi:MAG TPA: anthranilate phosphoribosyltransferase, partial [Stellaceae bacterium]|nr:anthranilate phosphoribosyltransferase [Stellaceae bacterium]
PAENAARLVALLEGEPGPLRDVVLLNAAAALIVAGKAADLRAGAARAAQAIRDGSARQALSRLVAITNERPPA